MRQRVIREAMLEAHQIAEEFGGTWYVLNDDFMSVVKESYFIEEDGTRKDKPFVSLYNTKDKRYNRHTVDYVDGEIVIGEERGEYFEQPYGKKQATYELMGEEGHGKTFIVKDHYKEVREMSDIVSAMGMGSMTRHDPYVRALPKIGRNEPCPCGSGKKFKKCCI